MQHPDDIELFEPPSPTEEDQEEFQRYLRRIQSQRAQAAFRRKLARRRERKMSSSSSEAEVTGVNVDGTAKLTPASGSTPPEDGEKKVELVKLDPKEIGKVPHACHVLKAY